MPRKARLRYDVYGYGETPMGTVVKRSRWNYTDTVAQNAWWHKGYASIVTQQIWSHGGKTGTVAQQTQWNQWYGGTMRLCLSCAHRTQTQVAQRVRWHTGHSHMVVWRARWHNGHCGTIQTQWHTMHGGTQVSVLQWPNKHGQTVAQLTIEELTQVNTTDTACLDGASGLKIGRSARFKSHPRLTFQWRWHN